MSESFPRIGNGKGRFFQALEKFALTFSKAWKKHLFRFPMLGNPESGYAKFLWSLLCAKRAAEI